MRQTSELSYRRRINQVVAYVNDHLGETLDGMQLADLAAMSRFHFHRVFAAMTGMTPSQYVQRSRLSAALDALRTTSQPVGCIALDCGFDGGPGLAKAMRRELGLSPSAARKALTDPRLAMAPVQAPPHHFRRKTMLTPTFRELPQQKTLCATERGMVNNEMSAAAQKAFGRLIPAAQALGVLQRQLGCLGVCPDVPKGPNDPEMRFVAAFVFDGAAPAVGDSGLTIDAMAPGRFAVFRHVGPYTTLWQTWQAVYRDWVPRSGIALRDAPPYERYENDPTQVPPEQLITDIYVPIV